MSIEIKVIFEDFAFNGWIDHLCENGQVDEILEINLRSIQQRAFDEGRSFQRKFPELEKLSVRQVTDKDT